MNKEKEWVTFKDNAIEKNVPEHTAMGLADYVIYKYTPGSFLRSVLSNDLTGAFSNADNINSMYMKDIVSFLYNVVPSTCWGSKEKVQSWLEG